MKEVHFGTELLEGIILVLYGIIPTLQNFPTFGRVYAAYGGVFIILSVLWGWGVDKKAPDTIRLDWRCYLLNWSVRHAMGSKTLASLILRALVWLVKL